MISAFLNELLYYYSMAHHSDSISNTLPELAQPDHFIAQNQIQNDNSVSLVGNDTSVSKASEEDEGEEIQPLQSYILIKTLGKGNFGKVKLATHKLTNAKVAIKILYKDLIFEKTDIERISREIKIMKQVKHPFIIQLYQIIETPKELYLVMEYAEKGDLYDEIVRLNRLPEQKIANYFSQIVLGLEYLHQCGITHRDMKPENILLSDDGHIKIADFGLGNFFKDEQKLKTACGSPCYAPPEMLSLEEYDPKKIDIWSSGIILYAMSNGYLPFEDSVTAVLYQKIKTKSFKVASWVSIPCRNLIRGILIKDPLDRWSIDIIKKHQFLKETITGLEEFVAEENGPLDLSELKQVCASLGIAEEDRLVNCLKKNKHNNLTTIFYLGKKALLKQKAKIQQSPNEVSLNVSPQLQKEIEDESTIQKEVHHTIEVQSTDQPTPSLASNVEAFNHSRAIQGPASNVQVFNHEKASENKEIHLEVKSWEQTHTIKDADLIHNEKDADLLQSEKDADLLQSEKDADLIQIENEVKPIGDEHPIVILPDLQRSNRLFSFMGDQESKVQPYTLKKDEVIHIQTNIHSSEFTKQHVSSQIQQESAQFNQQMPLPHKNTPTKIEIILEHSNRTGEIKKPELQNFRKEKNSIETIISPKNIKSTNAKNVIAQQFKEQEKYKQKIPMNGVLNEKSEKKILKKSERMPIYKPKEQILNKSINKDEIKLYERSHSKDQPIIIRNTNFKSKTQMNSAEKIAIQAKKSIASEGVVIGKSLLSEPSLVDADRIVCCSGEKLCNILSRSGYSGKIEYFNYQKDVIYVGKTSLKSNTSKNILADLDRIFWSLNSG